MQVRAERNHAVKGHAQAKEQGDAVEGGGPDAGQIQNECRTVKDRVGDHRLKEHIVCLSEAVEGGVEDVLEGVEHIEAQQKQHELEELVHFCELQNVCHEGLPQGDADAPEQTDRQRQEEIARRIPAHILPAFGGLLLDQLSQLEHRQQEPAPDEIVGDPVGPLLSHHVHHPGDHHHVSHVAYQGFQAGDPADPRKLPHPAEVEPFLGEGPHAFPVQQQKGHSQQQGVHKDVGIPDTVHAELQRDRERGDEEGIEDQGEQQSCGSEDVEIAALVYRDQGHQDELRQDGEDVGDALDADIGRGGGQNAVVGGHQPQQGLGKEQDDDRQHKIGTEGDQHSRPHAVGEGGLVLFDFADKVEKRQDDCLTDHLVQQVDPGELSRDGEGPVSRQLPQEEDPQRRVDRRTEPQHQQSEEQPPVVVFQRI